MITLDKIKHISTYGLGVTVRANNNDINNINLSLFDYDWLTQDEDRDILKPIIDEFVQRFYITMNLQYELSMYLGEPTTEMTLYKIKYMVESRMYLYENLNGLPMSELLEIHIINELTGRDLNCSGHSKRDQ